MTFGERIVTLRKRLKWSQEQLAKKIGTSAPIVGRYERNEIRPSIETAKKIADALEISVDYLITGKETSLLLGKETVRRIEAIEQLPKNDKSKIYDYIDLILRDYKTRQAYAA